MVYSAKMYNSWLCSLLIFEERYLARYISQCEHVEYLSINLRTLNFEKCPWNSVCLLELRICGSMCFAIQVYWNNFWNKLCYGLILFDLIQAVWKVILQLVSNSRHYRLIYYVEIHYHMVVLYYGSIDRNLKQKERIVKQWCTMPWKNQRTIALAKMCRLPVEPVNLSYFKIY